MRERAKLRGRWPVLPAQQLGENFVCPPVVADKLRRQPFGRKKEIHCRGVLPAHGVGAGKFETYLRAPADQAGGDRRDIESLARLGCGPGVAKLKMRRDG